MEGRDDYKPPVEKHLSRDLPPHTAEQLALRALIDRIGKLKNGDEDE
jgi:hypothetical protein